MLRFGNAAAIVCLLFLIVLGGCVGPAEATGHPEDPYLIIPPELSPGSQDDGRPKDLGEKEFTLRHIYHHGTAQYPRLHRYRDIRKEASLMVADEKGEATELAPERLKARAMSTNVERMTDRSRAVVDGILDHVSRYGNAISLPASAWTVDEIAGPNYTDKSTVITFAKMAANAYVAEPGTGDWMDVRGGFNYTDDFGWEFDGLRGHIFADEKNETLVIGLKGTSMAVFDGPETTGNDKLNDNLFASCCCGQGGHWTWKGVCECMSEANTCNATCVRQSLYEKNHYYWAVRDLYHNVTDRYPDAKNVWLSGHSLGGVVATLLGLTFGLPVMTYEAYPDALAASRLGLPVPPGYHIGAHQSRTDVAIHHFGHTADPIFMGTCNTVSSLCTVAGYALESSCHTGMRCEYDTVGDKSWRQSVAYHKILSVIPDVLEAYDEVPKCKPRLDCTDCYKWNFFESNGTETTTSLTSTSTESSRTRTRTETCKIPGWWGCLDETTTTGFTTTSTTSSSSTSTCETPGWFGCKDPTTTTSSTSSTSSPSASPAPTITTTSSPSATSSSSSSTTTCKTPGWFGCLDPTSTTSSTSPPSMSSNPATQTTCTSPAWFGLICLDPSPTDSSSATAIPSSTSPPPSPPEQGECVRRYWFGWCKAWRPVSSWHGDL